MKSKKATARPPRTKRNRYWTVFWRVKGHECSVNCGQWGAADQAVRCIGCGADIVVITICTLEQRLAAEKEKP